MDCIDNGSSLTMDWWHGGLGQWRGRPAEVTVWSEDPEARVDPLRTPYWFVEVVDNESKTNSQSNE